MAKEVIIKIKADTKEAERGVEDLNKDLKSTANEVNKTDAVMGLFGQRIQGLRTSFIALKGGIIQGVRALFTLKGALIATGIGALLVAIGSLVQYFTRSERGANKLNAVMAGLGAVLSEFGDRIAAFGESLFNAFNDPKQAVIDLGNSIQEFFIKKIEDAVGIFKKVGGAFKKIFSGDFKEGFAELGDAALDVFTEFTPGGIIIEGVKDGIDAVKDTVKQAVIEGKKAFAFTDELLRLKSAQRDLNVEQAKSRAIIAGLKLEAEDLNKSVEDRITAAQKAFDLEQKQVEESKANLQAQVSLLTQINDLGESTAEQKQELADLEIALAGLTEQSLGLQTELNNKIVTFNNERIANEKDFQSRLTAVRNEADVLRAEDEQAKAIVELEQEQQRQLAELTTLKISEDQKAQLRIGIEQNFQTKLLAIKNKTAEEEKKLDKDVNESKIAAASGVVSSLSGLAKEGSEQAKAFAILETTISTFRGAQNAFTSAAAISPIAGVIAAAAATAAGLKRIAAIRSTSLGSTSTPTAGGGQRAFNFSSFTGGQSVQDVNVVGGASSPIQAFVLNGDINSSQNAANKLQSKTIL